MLTDYPTVNEQYENIELRSKWEKIVRIKEIVSKRLEEARAENLITDIINNEIRILLEKYDYTYGDISKIGIAVPGSPKGDKIRNLVNLNIKEYNIGKVLGEKYKTVVKIKNDGKCAGLAEKEYGALKKYDEEHGIKVKKAIKK